MKYDLARLYCSIWRTITSHFGVSVSNGSEQTVQLGLTFCARRAGATRCTPLNGERTPVRYRVAMNLSLGAAGRELGVSGGDLRRAGFRNVSEEQLAALHISPPVWLLKCRARKANNARRVAMKVAVPCSLCGASKLRTPSVATKAVGYILVCSACERRGLRPELVTKSHIRWTHEFNLAGGFTGWRPYEPPTPGSRDDRDEFMFRALNDGASDVEALREWNRYTSGLVNRHDDRPFAEIIVLHDRSAKS